MPKITQPVCGWIDSYGEDCADDPEGTILLRDRLIAGRVLVCRKHKAEYNRTAAAARVASRDSQGSAEAERIHAQKPHPTPSMRRV